MAEPQRTAWLPTLYDGGYLNIAKIRNSQLTDFRRNDCRSSGAHSSRGVLTCHIRHLSSLHYREKSLNINLLT